MPKLVLCKRSFRINFGVKAAQIDDRKLIRIALIRINLRSLRSPISASFHARNCLKNFVHRVLVIALCTLGFLYTLGPDTLNAEEFPNAENLSSAEVTGEKTTPAHKITGLVIESLASLPSEETLDPFLGVWVDPELNLPTGRGALANILKKYIGSPLDESNLLKLRSEVSKYYKNLKRDSVSIHIDPQDVTDGVVHVLISEPERQVQSVIIEDRPTPSPPLGNYEVIRANEPAASISIPYTLIANNNDAVDSEEGSLAQQMETLKLGTKEKFALLAEKSDCLAETLGAYTCRDLPINSRVQNQMENGIGLFVTADFLYWQASEDGLEYAVYDQGFNHTAQNPSTPVSDKLYGLNFDWNPGFRVGIGGSFDDCDYWGILLDYTYIYNKAHGSVNIGPLDTTATQFLTSTWDPILLGIYASAASAHWSVHYSTETLEGYRDFFLGKNLIVKPHMGLLNANIRQNYHAAYTLDRNAPISSNIPQSHMHAKCNYWGLGILGGADLFWHFTKNFGLYGEFSAGIVYGKFHVTRNGDSVIPSQAGEFASPYSFKFHKKMWRTRAMIQTALGLEWETVFNCDRNRIAISLGYEFNEWFKQNQFVQSFHQAGNNPSLVSYNFVDADLAFQGATLRTTFNF